MFSEREEDALTPMATEVAFTECESWCEVHAPTKGQGASGRRVPAAGSGLRSFPEAWVTEQIQKCFTRKCSGSTE